ncbi:MAG: hypothetical protein COA57_14885, partial [Flavobacteriales bacterium]
MTNRQIVNHDAVGGLNRHDKPHLIPVEQWYGISNIRPATGTQVPMKKTLMFLRQGSKRPIKHLANLPVGHLTVGQTIGLSDDTCFFIGDEQGYAINAASFDV